MKKIIMICSTVVLLGFSAIMMAGCEAADGYSIEVNVSSYSVSDGGRVYLSATGWDDYTWALSDSSLGSLSKLNGPDVVYSSRSSSGTQNITVTARGSGASVSTTTSSTTSSSNSTNKSDTVVSSPLVRTITITHE